MIEGYTPQAKGTQAMTNKLFPGRPNYTGPKSGPFGLLHHRKLWEWSHDVTERVDYIRREKPENELSIRLHNMIYLGGCPVFKGRAWADYLNTWAAWDKAEAAWDKAWADWIKAEAAWIKAGADYLKAGADWGKAHPNADAKILAYIRKHIQDCAWDGGELVFPKPRGVK